MTVLALDTAGPRPSVALISNGRLFEEPLPDDRRASEDLLPAIRRVLDAGGIRLGDCERIGVCAGPGSFTGVRVGLATAWALGRAAGIAVEAVSTLEAMAEGARLPGRERVVAALDAGRGDVVAERFELGGLRARSIAPQRVLPAGDLPGFAGVDPLVVGGEERNEGVAAALARAIARSPRPLGERDPRSGLAAVYSRPSAAEEKHGAA
jgi:tRNA threonylcarbamoyl adenosine modification protein YeaZ